MCYGVVSVLKPVFILFGLQKILTARNEQLQAHAGKIQRKRELHQTIVKLDKKVDHTTHLVWKYNNRLIEHHHTQDLKNAARAQPTIGGEVTLRSADWPS
eukprot:COSAG01_NODE_2345_length_7860_cov_23.900528_6_plen_100_part_00